MADIYLDHNVSSELVLHRDVAGHDVATTRVTGEARASDDVLLLASVRANRLFITHNRADFRLLHDAWTTWPAAFGLKLPPHPGILVLDTSPPVTLAIVITEFLDAVSPERLGNAMFWWHHLDGWRSPAINGRWVPMRLDAGQ